MAQKPPSSIPPRRRPQEPAKPAADGGPHENKRAKSTSLLIYLIIICFFGNLIPYIITTSVNCAVARSYIRQAAIDHLVSVRDIKKRELENFFFERRGNAYQLCTNILFKWAITSYVDAYRRGGMAGGETAGLKGQRYKEVDERYHRILSGFADAYQYYDVLIVDVDGNVVASAKKNPEIGANLLKDEKYRDTTLAKAFDRGKMGLTVTDMEWYDGYNGPAQFVAAPIIKESEDAPLLGVLILFMDGTLINDIMQQRPGLKESGETYLVGQDFLMRSDSRFTTNASEILKLEVDTNPSRKAINEGVTDYGIYRDYRGVKVISAFTPIQISPEVRWALIAEIDKAEALSMEGAMISRVVWMTFAMIPIWVLIIFLFYRIMKQEFLTEE